ncbi:ligase-associated DNA damage response endonuclease PdeM [Acidocella facilis]|uniref:ligase-associated DNA damage response endonuclease PdeM n=1 Tax=Acidocella facilis TaxID=525 RepID=UPI00047CFF8D|nr:ligase-associated DNA damage response endonuclease PdeM [Acidocella facilis]
MTAAPIHFRNERLMLDPSGAAFWPAKRVLIVADLHFEKSSSLAARGALLPPFDTRATLERLTRLVRLYRPSRLIALGDSFHDVQGHARLSKDDRTRLEAIGREAQIIWIAGNHDATPHDLPGQCVAEHREGPFVFRHQAQPLLGLREIELSGHFHPKASIESRAKRVSRPCFVSDGSTRLILPAFGALTGGLDVREAPIARLFPRGLRVFMLGQEQLYSFALEQLGRLAEVA